MECEFYEAINLGIEIEDWEFTKMSCVSTSEEILTLIESESTDAEFYLEKTISYGDVFMIVFVSIFIIAITCKWVAEFVFKKR